MKLHILGASSTGVTTLGLALSKQLGIPYFDNDDFFWAPSEIPFTHKADPAIRNSNVKNALGQHESWVLGGSAINWGKDVFPEFDLIIFLWVPPAIRMERLKQRELQRYGDLIYTGNHRKKLYEDFISWAEDYDRNTGVAGRTLQVHEAWLATKTTPVIEIRGEQTTEDRLKIVREKINQLQLK